MGMLAVNEASRQCVGLRWRGLPPHWFVRVVAPVMLGVLAAGCLSTFWMALGPKLPPGWPFRFEWLWRVAAVGLLVTAALVVIVRQFFWITSHAMGYCKHLSWDARESAFRASFSGWCWFGRQQIRLPLQNITSIDMQIGAETATALPLRITVAYLAPDEESFDSTMADAIEVEGIDKRAEALDLLFRIGRATGMAQYVVRNVVRDLQVRLVREKQDSREVAQPIPQIQGTPQYDLDLFTTTVALPQIEVSEFDLKTAQRSIRPTEIVAWKPRQRVEFHTPAAPAVAYAIVGAMGAIIFGAIGGFVASSAEQPLAIGLGIGAVGGTALTSFILFFLGRRRQVVFDWSRAELSCHTGRRLQTRPLSDVEGLALRGIDVHRQRLEETGPRHRSKRRYRCRLCLLLTDREVWLGQTFRHSSSPDTPFQELAPLTRALAESLEVPWRWDEYATFKARPFEEVWESPRTAAIAAAAMVLLFLGWMLATGIDWSGTAEAARRIQAHGGEVLQLSELNFRDWTVLEDFWKVKFDDAGFDDQQLLQLKESLAVFPKLALDLSGTRVTDRAIGALADLKNLRVLNLRTTAVSDAGLAELKRLDDVVYLDLRLTRMTEGGLAHLAHIESLRFLFLATPRLSDENVAPLKGFGSLTYVEVGSPFVTPAGIDQLQQALPETTVEPGNLSRLVPPLPARGG